MAKTTEWPAQADTQGENRKGFKALKFDETQVPKQSYWPFDRQ
jgi:hypothetical protein